MTRRYPTTAEARALTIGCGLCGAHDRTWCRTVWTRRPGLWATNLHRERLAEAMRDGTLPIDLRPVKD
jgi:hypothetical protein